MNRKNFIGRNCFDDLSILIREHGYKKILIISGNNSFEKTGAKEKLQKILENKEKKLFFKKHNYTDSTDLAKCIVELKLFKPDVILSLGGGAVLDLAKIANCLYDEENYINKIINETLLIKKKFTTLIAIPTTAGSGAEVTSNAVLYIKKKKYSIEGKEILPDFSFIDPELVMSLPKTLSAAAGFDAVSQSIESIFSLKSNKESIEFALKSLDYSLNNIENHINDKSFSSAYNMCNASYLSGKAINISKTTAPHAVSYPFTSFWGIQHGHAVSLTLNDFIEYNFKNKDNSVAEFDLNKRFKLIFDALQVTDIEAFKFKINKILYDINLETNLKKLKISSVQDIEKIVSNVNEQRLKNNPVNLSSEIIKEILLKKI